MQTVAAVMHWECMIAIRKLYDQPDIKAPLLPEERSMYYHPELLPPSLVAECGYAASIMMHAFNNPCKCKPAIAHAVDLFH